MTQQTSIPQGPPGPPSSALLGPGFVVPAVNGPAITITAGNDPLTGAPTGFSWAFAGMVIGFLFNGTSYGFLTVVARPNNSQIQVQNTGQAIANTSVPAGASITNGAPGPTGPVSSCTVAAPGFTMPPADGATPVTIPLAAPGSSWMGVGANLAIAGAGYLKITAVPSGLSVTCVNPVGLFGNALPNAQIAAGASVNPGGPSLPYPIYGITPFGANGTGVALPFDSVKVPAGQTVVCWTFPGPNIAINETVQLATVSQYIAAGGGQQGFGASARLIRVTNLNNILVTPNGSQNDSDVTADKTNYVGGLLANAGGTSLIVDHIVPSGSTLTYSVQNTSTVDIEIGGTFTATRLVFPGSGPIPVVTSVSVASGPGTGGTVLLVEGQHFTGETAITICGVAATVVSDPGNSDTQIKVSTGAFFGVPNVAGNVSVTNPNGTGSLPGGYTYTSTAATPPTISGSSLLAWYPNSTIQHTGTTPTAWNDASVNGINLPFTGSGTYNSSSASISPAGPSVDLAGAGMFVNTNVPYIVNAPVTIILFVRPKSAASTQALANIGGGGPYGIGFSGVTAGEYDVTNGTNSGAALSPAEGTVRTNVTNMVTYYSDGAVGTQNTSITVGGNATVSYSGTSSAGHTVNPEIIAIGARNGLVFPSTAEYIEAVFHIGQLSPTQFSQYRAYGQQKYGVA